MVQRPTIRQGVGALLFSAVVLSSLNACTKPADNNYYYNQGGAQAAPTHSNTLSDGGQHGGGGLGQGSDQKDVRAMIGLALRMVQDPDPRKNPVMRFVTELNEAQNLRLELIFPKLPNDLLKRNETTISFSNFDFIKEKFDNPSAFESPALQALVNNKRTLKVDGPCPEPENKNADASVSELDLNGELCISIANLSRLPSDALLASILGILVHEAVHLAGGEEKEAVEWQKTFDRYVKGRFASFTLKDIVGPIEFTLRNGQACIDGFGRHLNFKPEEVFKNLNQVYICAYEIMRNLANIPGYWDPLELQLYIRPAHPERVYYLSNAILKTMEDIDLGLNLGIAPPGPGPNTEIISREKLGPVLVQIRMDLDILQRAYEAYRHQGAPKLQECPLAKNPKFYISNPRLNRPSPGLGGPFLPPSYCEIDKI